MDGDVTQKSSFGALDTELSDSTREDRTLLSQGNRMDDGEMNTLVFQACCEDPTTDIQHKQIEVPSKKVPENLKLCPSKSIGIKTSKSLKRQGTSPGNTSPCIQGSLAPMIALVDLNGSKFPRFPLPWLGWVIWHRNRVVVISDEMIAQIRAAPTDTLGWFDQTLCNAWKNLFPITPTSIRTGDLALDHPA